MTWTANVAGDYQSVVRQLKDLQPTGDDRAIEHGHVQIAKDAALVVIDSKKQLAAAFSVSLGGHTSTKDSFAVSSRVTVTQNHAEPG